MYIHKNIGEKEAEELRILFYKDVNSSHRDVGYPCPLMRGFSKNKDKARRIFVESCDCPTARKVLMPLSNCTPNLSMCPVREAMKKRV